MSSDIGPSTNRIVMTLPTTNSKSLSTNNISSMITSSSNINSNNIRTNKEETDNNSATTQDITEINTMNNSKQHEAKNCDMLVIPVSELEKTPSHKSDQTQPKSIHSKVLSMYNKCNAPLNITVPNMGIGNFRSETLPANCAIPIGLAQVFVGLSMVVCGIFSLRYQSYLFHYGSGFWAGTLASITGCLGVMATKKGLAKPKWLCGGRKWQIHVFLSSAMLTLSAAVLLAIFSTTGLVRDSQHSVGMTGPISWDEERYERRKSSGIAINAILLFLSLLEILLGFCSIGIALRVLCRSRSGSLLSSSSGSEVTMRDILGSPGSAEYKARKDRLIKWLNHQRRNFFASMGGQQTPTANSSPPLNHSRTGHLVPVVSNKGPHSIISVTPFKNKNRLIPHFVTPYHVQPQNVIPPPNATLYPYPMMPHHRMPPPAYYPQPMLFYGGPPPSQMHHPIMVMQNPVQMQNLNGPRRAATPAASLPPSERSRRRQRQRSCSESSVKSRSKSRSGSGKNGENEIEITDEDVTRTYTGLDRSIAESYICNTINSR